MKTKILLLSIIIFFFNKINSQEKINISVQYKLNYKLDSLSDVRKNENFTLLVGEKKGYFLSSVTYIKDSLLLHPDKELRTKAEKLITENNYYIVLEPSKKMIHHYQPNEEAGFYYSASDKINWKISTEYKNVLGIKTRKATTNAFGRKWEAWYTEDYPFPMGPYKFQGLPGLILEVYDTKREYVFEAFKIKKYKNKVYNLNCKNYLSTNKKKFWEKFIQIKYSINPEFYNFTFEDENVIPTMKRNLEEKRKRENNPLEKIK